MKALRSRIAFSVVLAACLVAAPRAGWAVNATLWVPDGVAKLRGIIACTSVGVGAGWCKSADFQALAKRLEVGLVSLSGENAFGPYGNRCTGGEFKGVLDQLAALGKSNNHPELANAPIVGCGHSHGGDYWNYFNACFPERMALVFDKSAGGVQYSAAALKTPMVWEIGTNDLKNSMGHFRGDMFAHRSKGTPLSLVLGPGETHGSLTPGPRAMVIELIEAIFNLRVSKEADPSAGPVTLNVIDESSGAYWLGDNYSKEIGAWATFPGKSALQKTSFLPNEAIANKWKMSGAPLPAAIQLDSGGVCTTCYKQPAGEPKDSPTPPASTDAGTSGGPPPADAGASSPDSAPAGPADAGGGSTVPTVKLDARSAPDPDPGEDAGAGVAPARAGGCQVGGTGRTPVLALLALALLGLRRRRS
jgi:MYXO-CTERM domain-containing protein